MQKMTFLILSLFLISCSSAPKLGKATGTGEKVTGPIQTVPVYTYRDSGLIPKKIKDECTALGKVMSDSAKKLAAKRGVEIKHVDRVRKDSKGNNMMVEILNATSSGNAFIGHKKSMIIRGSLYVDGRLVDEVEFDRSSGGGMGAGFKSSCTVMNKVASKLGEDLAVWTAKYAKK